FYRGHSAPCLVVDELVHGRVVAAEWAALAVGQLELAEGHVLALEEQVAADHWAADAEQVLDRLERHHAADDPGQHSKNTRLGAALHLAWRRRFREEAAVAAGALGGVEQRQPALEPQDAPVHERLLEKVGGV